MPRKASNGRAATSSYAQGIGSRPYQRHTRRGPHRVGRHQHPPPRFQRQPPQRPRCRPSPQPCRTCVTSLVCFARCEIGKARASSATIDVAKAPNSAARQISFRMSTPFFIASVQLRSLERSQAPYIAPSVDLFSIGDCPEFPMFSRETIPLERLCPTGHPEAASSQRTASAVTSPFCPPQVVPTT